jgi:hypothetical protein
MKQGDVPATGRAVGFENRAPARTSDQLMEEIFVKNNMKKVHSTIGIALALTVGLAFSGTASAFTFEHGWSCQNKWYQMGLIELIACGGGGDG